MTQAAPLVKDGALAGDVLVKVAIFYVLNSADLLLPFFWYSIYAGTVFSTWTEVSPRGDCLHGYFLSSTRKRAGDGWGQSHDFWLEIIQRLRG